MSGHSKWATTKHKKAVIDAKRAKVFTKLGHLVTIAAKNGKSGDLNFNPALRMAVDNAKAFSMPKENIDRAIKRGTGAGADGTTIEELSYEVYGPYGIGMIIECLTDNKNRTVADIKTILNRVGGSIAGVGSVSYQFQKVGEIAIDGNKNSKTSEEIENIIIESGADDFDSDDNFYVVRTNFANLHSVNEYLNQAEVVIDSAEITQIATSPISLEPEKEKTIKDLVEKIEEIDDVTDVYTTMA